MIYYRRMWSMIREQSKNKAWPSDSMKDMCQSHQQQDTLKKTHSFSFHIRFIIAKASVLWSLLKKEPTFSQRRVKEILIPLHKNYWGESNDHLYSLFTLLDIP